MGIRIERQLPGNKYVVVEDYSSPYGIIIPKGFRCDHASIPRFLWSIICPQDLSDEAPVMHDFLYRRAGLPTFSYATCTMVTFTRKQADKMFRDLMIFRKVEPWKRIVAYRAVRLFAYFVWRKHYKENTKGISR